MENIKIVIKKYAKVLSDINYYSLSDPHRGLKFHMMIDFLGNTRSVLKNDKITVASSENGDFYGNVNELKLYIKNVNLTKPDKRVITFEIDQNNTSQVTEYQDHVEVCRWLLAKLTYEEIGKKICLA
jgi:hypothetical protein